MGIFDRSSRNKEEEKLFAEMEYRISKIIARGKDPRDYDDVVLYLLFKEDKKKKCAKCNKRLIAPNWEAPEVFTVAASGLADALEAAKEITDKIFARAVYCVQCERFYCEGCAFKEGQNLRKKRLICPKCSSDLGHAPKL